MIKNLHKTMLVLLGWVMLGNVAMAQNSTTVGAEDNTTAWWTSFSDYYTIESNKTLHLEFENYHCTNAEAVSKEWGWDDGTSSYGYRNWFNPVIVLANVEGHSTADNSSYAEYAVLRLDNYGWGSAYDGNANESNWNWSVFETATNGAKVTMDIIRSSSTVKVKIGLKGTDNNDYYQNYTLTVAETDPVVVSLSVEHSHIVIDNTATKLTDTETTPVEPTTETVIGLKDKTSGWWGDHSALNTLSANKTLHMEFQNFTSGTENYHNWVLVVTDGKHVSDAGYSADNEYVILRSDNFGWGSKYSAGTLAHYRSLPIEGFDDLTDEEAKANLYWTTFRNEMEGANVSLDVVRYGKQFKVTATMTATSGVQWIETFTSDEFVDETQDLGVFLTVDHCYLVIDDTKTTITESEAITDGISSTTLVKDDANAIMFDLSGRRVDASYKGIVIKNGKKVVVK